MIGPPGAGKTLLARALPGVLPRMSIDEALDVTRIYSIADQLPSDVPLIQQRPFRAPHHTISHAGLVGGGNWPNPGEISLAHRGVLFLHENFILFEGEYLHGLEFYCELKLNSDEIRQKPDENEFLWLELERLGQVDIRPVLVRDRILEGTYRDVHYLVSKE